jgi:hypothetical protein
MATEHLIDPTTLDTEALALRGEVYWGVVSAVVDRDIVVSHDGRSSLARRAASCLLAPRPGDAVLVARVEGRLFVLAVLERDDDRCEIEVEGDLSLRASGTMTLEADHELRLRTPGALRATSKTLTLAAQQAIWVGEQLSVLADHLSMEATRIRQAASFSEVVVESLKETLGWSYRGIRESEHVTAGSLTLSLRGVLRAHADMAVVTAKKLVKMNADQIHLG